MDFRGFTTCAFIALCLIKQSGLEGMYAILNALGVGGMYANLSALGLGEMYAIVYALGLGEMVWGMYNILNALGLGKMYAIVYALGLGEMYAIVYALGLGEMYAIFNALGVGGKYANLNALGLGEMYAIVYALGLGEMYATVYALGIGEMYVNLNALVLGEMYAIVYVLDAQITAWTETGFTVSAGTTTKDVTMTYDTAVPESTAAGSAMFTLEATPTASSGARTYAFTAAGNPDSIGLITESGNVATINVATGKALDYETSAQYVFVVEATETGTTPLGTATVTVSISDVAIEYTKGQYGACLADGSTAGGNTDTAFTIDGSTGQQD
ncbi:hypothetical protein MAR_035797 [Mya arenaria]|uniref:Cadherin domain-containing protein n=1 Tax=Mya arenaria TaxID=6604 RepID=A0ABY7EU59_MYAAR|nr:hypothetical protein MAR_035797 [Mya arenaria]